MAHKSKADREEMKKKFMAGVGDEDSSSTQDRGDTKEDKEESKPAKGESKTMVSRISIEILSDGSFLYEVTPKEKESNSKDMHMAYHRPERYAIETVAGVMDAVEDDLGSPHMRGDKPAKKKSGKGLMGKLYGGKY